MIPEERRADQVHAAADEALGPPASTTVKSLPKADLKLPAQAHGDPAGYRFPATYPVDEKTTPGPLLRLLVDTARKK